MEKEIIDRLQSFINASVRYTEEEKETFNQMIIDFLKSPKNGKNSI